MAAARAHAAPETVSCLTGEPVQYHSNIHADRIMGQVHTEEDVRADKITAMGNELGELHFLLWKDITWLHFEWNQFRELFGTDPSRMEIMNDAAPRFFWSLERVLWQDILLSISRLSDPVGTGGQQNLTLRRLLPALAPNGPRDALVSALDAFELRSKFARDWRHALFAHRALKHASAPDANPLPHASRANVGSALKAASDVMNVIELHYQDATVGYDVVNDPIGGAHDLLLCLDRGLQARAAAEDDDILWEPSFK